MVNNAEATSCLNHKRAGEFVPTILIEVLYLHHSESRWQNKLNNKIF